MTEFPICAIRSVDLMTPDIERSTDFYTAVWGLELVEEANGVRYLRATGADHHVLALHPDPTGPALRSVTFRCASRPALDAVGEKARAHGCDMLSFEEDSLEPGGGTILSFRSPQGCVIRLVHGDRLHSNTRDEPDRPNRMSHVNLNTTDVDDTLRFFCDVLGMQLTDRSRLMGFVRCNADHHCVVLAQAPLEGLNHIAFMMPDWESVMRGSGHMIDHGFPIQWGVGRHGPGDNIFAYFMDPTSVVIEYTAEVLQVDDSYRVGGPDDWIWPPGRIDQWGIAPRKTAACEKAQLAVPFA